MAAHTKILILLTIGSNLIDYLKQNFATTERIFLTYNQYDYVFFFKNTAYHAQIQKLLAFAMYMSITRNITHFEISFVH